MKGKDKENLYKCPVCKGSSVIRLYFNNLKFNTDIDNKHIHDNIYEVKCYLCYGTGYVDWIDNVFYKKSDLYRKVFEKIKL